MGREKLETRNRHAKSKVLSQKNERSDGRHGGRRGESRGGGGKMRRRRRRETFKKRIEGQRGKQREHVKKTASGAKLARGRREAGGVKAGRYP